MSRIALALVIGLTLAVMPASAGGIPLVDSGGGTVGSAKVKLSKGSVALKTTGLGTLPSDVDTGASTFTAYLYKAYLSSTTDPAVEVFLGDVYPNSKGKGSVKVKLKGNLESFGFDQILVVAFSKDATESFDVATAPLQ